MTSLALRPSTRGEKSSRFTSAPTPQTRLRPSTPMVDAQTKHWPASRSASSPTRRSLIHFSRTFERSARLCTSVGSSSRRWSSSSKLCFKCLSSSWRPTPWSVVSAARGGAGSWDLFCSPRRRFRPAGSSTTLDTWPCSARAPQTSLPIALSLGSAKQRRRRGGDRGTIGIMQCRTPSTATLTCTTSRCSFSERLWWTST
eukprot:Amastigsp_a178233_20.p3 type:complete len:200 gc:universal Amastigsp_a178233_20:119-718(+)